LSVFELKKPMRVFPTPLSSPAATAILPDAEKGRSKLRVGIFFA
jgi:hypothetical protein